MNYCFSILTLQLRAGQSDKIVRSNDFKITDYEEKI